jgi:small subunit ribosomal protein S16
MSKIGRNLGPAWGVVRISGILSDEYRSSPALYPARARPLELVDAVSPRGQRQFISQQADTGAPTLVATKIRLMRLGKIRAPYYRIVIADSRTKRDGRVIETIGKYHPKEDPSFIEVDSDRVLYWLGVGAQPTEPVAAILRKTGDWQKFKGEPAPPPLLVKAAKEDRKMVFETAAREAAGLKDAETPKKKSEPRAAKPAKTAVAEPAVVPVAAEPADGPVATAAELPSVEVTVDEAIALEAAAVETPSTEVTADVADSE